MYSCEGYMYPDKKDDDDIRPSALGEEDPRIRNSVHKDKKYFSPKPTHTLYTNTHPPTQQHQPTPNFKNGVSFFAFFFSLGAGSLSFSLLSPTVLFCKHSPMQTLVLLWTEALMAFVPARDSTTKWPLVSWRGTLLADGRQEAVATAAPLVTPDLVCCAPPTMAAA